MKIGIEIQPILKNKTGVGWYTQKILENLQNSEDLNIEGYGFNFLNRNDITASLENINFDSYINKCIPYGVYRRIWNILSLSYNKIFRSDANVFHFSNFIVPPKIEGKVIVTVYDMVYKLFPETMARSNYTRLDKELKRSVERADKIITISENSKKEIIKYMNIEESKIDIIYPGIDKNEYRKNYTDERIKVVRNKYNLPQEYILYMGTLEPRKNIETLIDAYEKVIENIENNLCLVIAGQKGWMYKKIFEKIEKNNLRERVIITGYVEEKDKPLIYKMSKLFVFPSFYEGFGMPVLEAMAAGVPVIASNTSSLPEVVGDAGILINPNNTDELEEAIIEILHNNILRKELIEKGFKQIEKFSWKKSADKLIDIYKEVGKDE